jgi:hypothetical protein
MTGMGVKGGSTASGDVATSTTIVAGGGADGWGVAVDSIATSEETAKLYPSGEGGAGIDLHPTINRSVKATNSLRSHFFTIKKSSQLSQTINKRYALR